MQFQFVDTIDPAKPRRNAVTKVLNGQGRLRSIKPLASLSPWKGVVSVTPHGVWNPAHVEENRRLYPHLFVGE